MGNAPDPSIVGVDTGVVKYELVRYRYFIGDTGKSWNQMQYAPNVKPVSETQVEGVALFQLLDKDTLKMETFPGKSASEVSGFTRKAKIYKR